jgi:hypothetical protein
MARKYLLAKKDGSISKTSIKGGKNLTNKYYVAGYSKKKPVYVKKGVPIKPIGSKSKKYVFKREVKVQKAKRKARIRTRRYRAKAKPKVIKQKPKEEKPEGLVEVRGLVGVEYNEKKYFHAEMLFDWWGPSNFNVDKLLDSAVEILKFKIPEIERIPYELASHPRLYEDKKVRGIVRTVGYSGDLGDMANEMQYEIYIPTAKGRALFKSSARVNV